MNTTQFGKVLRANKMKFLSTIDCLKYSGEMKLVESSTVLNLQQEYPKSKLTAHPDSVSINHPKEPTLEDFLKSVSLFGCIMYYYYICDYEHHFPAGQRSYSRDLFTFLMLILFAVSAMSIKQIDTDKLLSRDQTEEWKGWMQVMFVWYHYFHAKETYNAIRVFIAAYVWMTGFGRNLLLFNQLL